MNERKKVHMMERSRKSERTLNSCMHGDDHGMERDNTELTTKTVTTTRTLTCSRCASC